MLRHALPVACLILLAGCTDVEPDAPPLDPVYGSGIQEPDGRIGRIAIDLLVDPSGDTVPADVDIAFTLSPTNVVGDRLDGTISWELAITGAEQIRRTGTSDNHTETFTLEERGAYLVVVRASGDIFRNATATATFALDPIPLEATMDAPDNATRGDWSALEADVAHGYSDLGHICQWSAPASALVVDPNACSTQVRWYEEGNQTVRLSASDGVENVTLEHQVGVAPLPDHAVPGAVPADLHVSAEEDPNVPDHVDIIGVWFESDLDHLFVGLAIQDPSTLPSEEATYSVTFTPSWNHSVEGGIAERFRVVSEEPVDDPTDIERTWRLQADVADSWVEVGPVDDAVFDTDAGLLWWPVPRDDLGAPRLDATISDPAASADVEGTISDSASSDAEYELD